MQYTFARARSAYVAARPSARVTIRSIVYNIIMISTVILKPSMAVKIITNFQNFALCIYANFIHFGRYFSSDFWYSDYSVVN